MKEQVSDYRGVVTVFDALPDADVLIADKGYDSDRFRKALARRGTALCSPVGRAARSRSLAMSNSTGSAI